MTLELVTFDNATGEGIVSFEPCRVSGSDYDEDPSRWYCHLLIAGKRVFEFGAPCGTCGIVFRKIASPTHRVSDEEAFRLLGNLDRVPSDDVLRRLARALEPGSYHPIVLEGAVRLVNPGEADDYFATDVVRLFGLEFPDYQEPGSPRTDYYKFGSQSELTRAGRVAGPHKALVTSVVMPLHARDQLSRERIEYWKRHQLAGRSLTAFAVSVMDHQAPAVDPADDSYPYKEQFLLTNCLLDGHHRIQAAAELGARIRILALLAPGFSQVASGQDLAEVLRVCTGVRRPDDGKAHREVDA
jgi:hypothetical protein